MKNLLGILIAMMVTTASQASTSLNGNPIPIVTQAKTVIQSVPVHVKSPRIPKFKVLRSNPYRYSKIVIDDIEIEIDDEGLISPYRRRDLTKIHHDDGISDHVRWRLFLARQMALLKYRERFG
jgi:hypothetical protein